MDNSIDFQCKCGDKDFLDRLRFEYDGVVSLHTLNSYCNLPLVINSLLPSVQYCS